MIASDLPFQKEKQKKGKSYSHNRLSVMILLENLLDVFELPFAKLK